MRIRSEDLFLSIVDRWLPGSTTISLIPRSNMSCPPYIILWIRRASILCLFISIVPLSTLTFAVPMQNDPNGFEGIPWGAMFSETDTFKKIEDTGPSQTRSEEQTTELQ